MKSATWSDRLRYQFDNYMSRGTGALISGLAVFSLVIIVIAGFIVSLGGNMFAPERSPGLSFLEAAWESMMRTLDAGTMGGDSGWGFRIVMFLVTLGGVFVISTLIGVLTSGVESKMDELRKGKSCLVILGEKDKVEMEDEIRVNVGDTVWTRIVCRSGSSIDTNDLRMVSLATSRSIIVLSTDRENPDADVIKTILAITDDPKPVRLLFA